MVKGNGVQRESEGVVVCAGRRIASSWLKSSRTVLQAGSVAKGGGNASLGVESEGIKEVKAVPEEHDAGQGVHREVESEGFAAKRRAVAEQGEPVGQIQVIPSLHYGGEGNSWSTWAQQGVCGRHGVEEACVTPGGLVQSQPTGRVPERISREVKSLGKLCEKSEWLAVLRNRGETKASGPLPVRSGGALAQKAVSRGKGPRRRWQARQRSRRVGDSGLMVAAAMTEALALRKPVTLAWRAR